MSARRPSVRTVPTRLGPARVTVDRPDGATAGTLFLGHGAGGGVESRDLLAARDAALGAGWVVARVEQPYRVAGRKGTPPTGALDDGLRAVLAASGKGRSALPRPWVLGGRSSGARTACRLAAEHEAAGVLCLAFPLHPPGTTRSRAEELVAAQPAARPVVVVQGLADPFGTPAEVRGAAAGVQVLDAAGDHGLRGGVAVVRDAVTALLTVLGAAGAR